MLDHVEIIYNNGNNNYIIDREMWHNLPCIGQYEEWLVNQIAKYLLGLNFHNVNIL